jgi:adenylate cyclase
LALSVSQKIKFRVTRQITFAAIALSLVYIAFARGFGHLHYFITGGAAGLLLGAAISFLELWVFSSGVRKIRFATLLTLRTLIYLILITFVIFHVAMVSRMIRLDMSYLQVLHSSDPDPDNAIRSYLLRGDFDTAVIFSLVFAFSINFTRLISRKIGQGMLLSHITGTYYTPVSETRIIMFLNISNSKKISLKLGPYKFHQFLKDFFFDITPPIVSRRGIIYEYVEDLVVISWSIAKGTDDANCIRAFFEIKETLAVLKEKYYNKYGFRPKIKAALHTGELVRAEIGDIKTQIVFHGDVMNTSSRVLDKTNDLDADFLVTRDLLDLINLPVLYARQSVGSIKLRGKGNQVELFKIWDKELTQL